MPVAGHLKAYTGIGSLDSQVLVRPKPQEPTRERAVRLQLAEGKAIDTLVCTFNVPFFPISSSPDPGNRAKNRT